MRWGRGGGAYSAVSSARCEHREKSRLCAKRVLCIAPATAKKRRRNFIFVPFRLVDFRLTPGGARLQYVSRLENEKTISRHDVTRVRGPISFTA